MLKSSIGRTLGAAALLAALALPSASRANGRFPSSGYFVAGNGGAVMVLRTTFGLVTSHDRGRTWGWVCEEALGAVGTFDPSVSVGFDGTIVVGTTRGLTASRGGCAWAAPPGSPARGYVDLSNDAEGRNLVAAIGPTGTDDMLVLSSDGGATWSAGAMLPGLFTETVEVAPSRASRVYVAGFVRGGIAALFRSDDGGRTVREVTRDFRGGSTAFISGVDPTNPDVVYVRSAMGLGTLLLRSDDGGSTFREIARTEFEMLGFAVSDDGSTVWAGSADRREGLLRSVRGGPFTRVAATVNLRCLRHYAGVLYVCADEAADGYFLGCSTNGGDRIDPLLSARSLMGPPAECGASTPVGSMCGPLWPTQRMALEAIDAGPVPTPVFHDAAVEGGAAEASVDVAAEASADVPPEDVAVDAAPPADVAADAPADAPADVATPDAGVDAPADVAADVTAMDAPAADVADVAVAPDVEGDRPVTARDAGGGGGGGTCGCRAGAAGSAGPWGVAALALAWTTRRRRRG